MLLCSDSSYSLALAALKALDLPSSCSLVGAYRNTQSAGSAISGSTGVAPMSSMCAMAESATTLASKLRRFRLFNGKAPGSSCGTSVTPSASTGTTAPVSNRINRLRIEVLRSWEFNHSWYCSKLVGFSEIRASWSGRASACCTWRWPT